MCEALDSLSSTSTTIRSNTCAADLYRLKAKVGLAAGSSQRDARGPPPAQLASPQATPSSSIAAMAAAARSGGPAQGCDGVPHHAERYSLKMLKVRQGRHKDELNIGRRWFRRNTSADVTASSTIVMNVPAVSCSFRCT